MRETPTSLPIEEVLRVEVSVSPETTGEVVQCTIFTDGTFFRNRTH